MLFHEFEEGLLRIRLSLYFLLLSSHGGQDRKTSSCNTSRLVKGLSKTFDRRAKSLPRCTARNPAVPPNFLPRIAFQPTEDDILRDCIAACKGLRQEKASLHVLHVCVLRLAFRGKAVWISEHSYHSLLPFDAPHVRVEKVPANVRDIRLAFGRFIPERSGNRGRRLFKKADRQGGIAEHLFSIAHSARTDFLGYRQYGGINRSSQVVNRIQQERYFRGRFSVWAHGFPHCYPSLLTIFMSE